MHGWYGRRALQLTISADHLWRDIPDCGANWVTKSLVFTADRKPYPWFKNKSRLGVYKLIMRLEIENRLISLIPFDQASVYSQQIRKQHDPSKAPGLRLLPCALWKVINRESKPPIILPFQI